MENKSITSGQQPKGISDKSYEMNGSRTYGTSAIKISSKNGEEEKDHYDREETNNSNYDKDDKP